ncbi:metallophosphoesterase [Actinomycetospora endophytica]|uniref:Metallophosphoesterase n=1 Tax=Actinomycetospora endophytica TaxID=2291215 RepID=A0ABS8P6S4_9PSEU|nr:metallophosphoesterase [Actinomycetospora endophytica]MCD2193949.1 metallophosphoesterase [Actinomycetospora endophytica]
MTRTPRGQAPDVGVPADLAEHMTVAEQHDWVRSFLHRHPVSRRTALKQGSGVVAALGLASAPWTLAACASAAGAPVAVVGRHLAFGDDPTRSMAMAGELTAPPPAGAMVVDLGQGGTFGAQIPVEVRRLVSQVPQADGSIRASDQYFVHALANGLQPGASYQYRFRMPDGTTTETATFTTAPRTATGPWSFTAFADQGVDMVPPSGLSGFTNEPYKPDDTRRSMTPSTSMVDRVAATRPAFHLLAGDICYADPSGEGKPVKSTGSSKSPSGFDSFDPTVWTTYFGLIERSAATTPWMFATGNHDMEALYDDNTAHGARHGYGGHAARLDLPRTGPSACPSVYSMRYGNVGVVSVDANDLSMEIPTNAGYSGGAQVTWLRQTLTGMRGDPAIDFVVAFFHHCAFATSASHASDAGVRAAVAPLFDEFSVDLALQGHNHQYERTNPIRRGRSAAQAPDGATVRPETDGTTYVCVGSGGRPRYSWQAGETDRYRGDTTPDSGVNVVSYQAVGESAKLPDVVDWSQARYLDYAYVTVDVVPPPGPGQTTTMTLRAITDTGQEIDRVTLERRAH